MPTKYWYKASNGSDNWLVAANWYLGSGGTGGTTTVPTSADDVIINAASGSGTITIATAANCKSLVMTGFTGTLTGTSTLGIAGGDASNNALILSASGSFTCSGTITFSGTGSYTITNNGKTFAGNLVFNSSAAGAWNVTDYLNQNAFNIAGTAVTSVTLTRGSLTFSNSVGPYNASIGSFISAGSLARTITFNNLELKGGLNVTATNTLVWNSSGATSITMNGNLNLHLTSTTVGRKFVTGHTSAVFGNLYLKGDGEFIGIYNTGSTFENIYATCADPGTYIFFGPSITVNGDIDLSGSKGDWRSGGGTITLKGNLILSLYITFVSSGNALLFTGTGNQVITSNNNPNSYNNTITINKPSGSFSFVNDFKSISTFTLTAGIVTCGYNLNFANITLNGGSFIQNAGTIAYTGTLTNAGTTSIFYTTVTGTSAANLTVSSGSVQFSDTSPNLGNVTIDGTVTQTGGTLSFYGVSSLTGSSNISGGTMTIASGSTYSQTTTGTAITLSSVGNLIINANCVVNRFTFNGGNSLVISSGLTINVTGYTTSSFPQWDMSTSPTTITGLNTCTLKFTNTTSGGLTIFNGGGLTYGTVWWNRINTTGTNRVLGSNTYTLFKDGNNYPNTTGYNILAHTIQFADGSTQTFNGFEVNGQSGKKIILNSISTGTYTFVNATASLITCWFLDVRHNQGTPYTPPDIYSWKARASIDGGTPADTTGWELSDLRYWVGGTGSWNTTNTTNWSYDSGLVGGTGGATVPTSIIDAIFDAGSGTGDCTVTASVTCANFDCTTSSVAIKSSSSFAIVVYDGASLGSSFSTFSNSLQFYFANKNVELNAGNTPLSCNVSTISGAGGMLILTNHLQTTGYIRSYTGTIMTMNGSTSYNVTCKYLYADHPSVLSQLYMNNSTFTITGRDESGGGAGYAWYITGTNAQVIGGTSTLRFTGSTLTNPSDFIFIILNNNAGLSSTYYNIHIDRGSQSGITSFVSNDVYAINEIRDLGTESHTVNFPNQALNYNVYTVNFIMSAPVGKIFTLGAYGGGTLWTIDGLTQPVCLERVLIQDCIGQDGFTKYNPANSTISNSTFWNPCVKQLGLLGVG
jgi:hypothetical protein